MQLQTSKCIHTYIHDCICVCVCVYSGIPGRWLRWNASKRSTCMSWMVSCAPTWTWTGPTRRPREASSTACSGERQVLAPHRPQCVGEGVKVFLLLLSLSSSHLLLSFIHSFIHACLCVTMAKRPHIHPNRNIIHANLSRSMCPFYSLSAFHKWVSCTVSLLQRRLPSTPQPHSVL